MKSVPGLTATEQTGIAKLLARVERTLDKPLHTTKEARLMTMESGHIQETLPRTDRLTEKTSRRRTVTWISLPYFCLAKYSASLSKKDYAHPMHTLMQTRFWPTKESRDKQQAVCSLPGNPTGSCFHVDQVWNLVLDDGKLSL